MVIGATAAEQAIGSSARRENLQPRRSTLPLRSVLHAHPTASPSFSPSCPRAGHMLHENRPHAARSTAPSMLLTRSEVLLAQQVSIRRRRAHTCFNTQKCRGVPGHPSQVCLLLRGQRTRPLTSCRQGRRHLRARSVERVVFFLRVARRCSSTQPTSQRVSNVLSCCCRCRFLTTGARGPAAALAKPIRPLTSTACGAT